MSATKKISGAHAGALRTSSDIAGQTTPALSWPRAALVLLILSLASWGLVAGIASLAFR